MTTVRQPVCSGSFYAASADQCRTDIDRCMQLVDHPDASLGCCLGGIVPHAGWSYSGTVAAAVFAALTRPRPAETFILIGATHRFGGSEATVFDRGCWRTPLGEIAIDEELADAVLDSHDAFRSEPESHQDEHSIEVQIPFIQHLAPQARLLPILLPPCEQASDLGLAAADAVRICGRATVVVGSTDLTHYGPRYGFTPHGVGDRGLRWARQINDRRMIDRILALDARSIVEEAAANRNACGSGAVAATIAACTALGATDATLLKHTTSCDESSQSHAVDAVGYAGIVFHAASNEPTTETA